MSKRWYVVHAYSGFEKSVQRALGERIQRSNVQDGSVLHCDPARPGDPDGSPLLMAPGRTWVEMPSPSADLRIG